MRCPLTSEIWQHYQDTGDSQVAKHLASCATCRAEAEQFAHLRASFAALPAPEVTGEVAARLQLLAASVPEETLTCATVRTLLDPWLEGELAPAQSFLVEEHLLGCTPCALELERAEALRVAMRALPQREAPAVIAERIAQARIPWWKKLLPAPAPVLRHQLGWAAGLAAALLLSITLTQMGPESASQSPQSPTHHTNDTAMLPPIPPITEKLAPPADDTDQDAPETADVPATPRLERPTPRRPHPVVNPPVKPSSNLKPKDRLKKPVVTPPVQPKPTTPARVTPVDPPQIAYTAVDDMRTAAVRAVIYDDSAQNPGYN